MGLTLPISPKGYTLGAGRRGTKMTASVVPCAAGGLAVVHARYFAPACWRRTKFGEKFTDATDLPMLSIPHGWINKDVIGIDVGITLLSAENLRSGNVWRWFMRNAEIRRAKDRL